MLGGVVPHSRAEAQGFRGEGWKWRESVSGSGQQVSGPDGSAGVHSSALGLGAQDWEMGSL